MIRRRRREVALHPMRRSIARVDEVLTVARVALRSDGLAAEHHPVGFGNENWTLRDADGSRYVLKIGEPDNAAKWRSSHAALELAGQAGLHVPDLIYLGDLDGRLVRIFTWIDGRTASNIAPGTEQSERLLRTTGSAVRALHTIRREAFSSRLDGSSPTFQSWRAYVDHRLPQIRARCEQTDAVDRALLDQACALAEDLAADVNDYAEAVLCHRDLHPGNLITDSDGSLIGIIDWDAAEAWDRAGDWFKLEFDLLTAHPDGSDILRDAYFGSDPLPEKWSERRQLVHLIESLNILPNAIAQDWTDDFSSRARAHLLKTLAP
jgi:aminoglycoside phosphotransferase (APT) family kinase protein